MIQAELIWSTIIITSPVCVVLYWMIWPKMKSLLKRCFGRYIPSDNLVRNCLLIMAVLLIECLCLEKLANNFIRFADHHLYWIKSNPTNDWIVALTAAALALWLFKQPKLLSYRTFGGFARFLVPACLLLFIGYVIFIHRSECTRFYCYSRFIYLDAPFTLLLLWWVMPLIKGYKSREEKLQKSEDDDTASLKPLLEPDDSEPIDELGRKEEAERLCHYIIDDKNDYHNTLAVAVRGSWGSGKTTFLNYMKSHLKAQGITFF